MRGSRKLGGDLLRTALVLGGFLAILTAAFASEPPVLDPIGPQLVYQEETTLEFTATATDPDVPATALTFGLTNAPTGASINPSTGEFSWTPTPAQYPGFYTFTVWVNDGEVPALSDSEVITVETSLGFPVSWPVYGRICTPPACKCTWNGNMNHYCSQDTAASCHDSHLTYCPRL